MIAVRASSLPELFDCPARWEARHIRGLRLPSSPAATLGKAVHAGTAAFDSARLNGSPISVDDAAGVAADAIHRPQEDVDWQDESPQEAEHTGIALTGLYCREIAPQADYIAVEAACERLEITDIGLVLTGTTDRVFRSESGYGIADIKTGKTAVAPDGTVKTQGHAAQVAVYELLAEQSTGLPVDAPARIIGLQAARTERGRRVGVGEIAGGRELLLGDEDNPGLLQHAAAILKSGLFHGNPRSALCSRKFCPAYDTCRFRR